MGTNPYTSGVFYSGSFVTTEFVQTFSELGVDRRVAILAEISARPEVSQLIMHRVPITAPTLENLATVYHYFHVNSSGVLTGGTEPTQFADKTDNYLNTATPPAYLIFTDQNLAPRYVTTATGPIRLVSSATKPVNVPDDRSQFVGEYLEFIGANGTSIYRVTVNSSNVVSVTLNRNEPQRIAPIRISNGHQFAYDGSHLWIEGLVSMDDISMEVPQFGGGFSGVVEPRIGNVSIQLSDHWFDYLIGQSWDTRDIEIKVGLTTDDIGDYQVVLRGKTERAEANLDRLSIVLRDNSVLLDRSMQDNSFAATGIYEGIGDVIGTLKPLCFGFVRHVTPVLTNDNANIYQLHDGPIHDIFGVTVGGRDITSLGGVPAGLIHLAQWFPSASEVAAAGYRHDLPKGAIRLAAPPGAPVTVSFWGDTSIPVSTTRVGEAVRAILARRAPEITINQNEFDAFHAEQVGGAGIYVSGEMSIRDALHQLVAPIGAAVYMNALNVMGIKRLRARTPVAFLGGHNLLEDPQPSRRLPPRPGAMYRIGYFKNWTPLKETDLLANATSGVRLFLQREYSYKEMRWYKGTMTRLPVHESANTTVYETLMDNTGNASELAAFLAFRDHSLQNLYQVTALGFAFQIKIGDTVLLQLDHLRLDNVKTGIVVGITEKSPTSSQEDFTELLIWA